MRLSSAWGFSPTDFCMPSLWGTTVVGFGDDERYFEDGVGIRDDKEDEFLIKK